MTTASTAPEPEPPVTPPPDSAAPGRHALGETIARFDRWADEQLERLRGNRVADVVFTSASALGDFSLIWHLVSATRALAPDRRPEHAVRVAAVLAVESALVNGPIKNLFRRHRPAWEQERPRRLRRPRTTSFPSGHASAAMTAAGVLAERDPLGPLYYALGAVVASSRVYVKIHHPSDVVAGALLGVALARIARRVWPLPDAGRAR